MHINSIRQVVLDTETTGMNKFGLPHEGHKIIEIGAVEIINRRLTNEQFHTYLNPNRSVDFEAFQIHGINDQFLLNKPIFSDIIDNFLKFIHGSELIIHNASFDLGFLNYELQYARPNYKKIESYCTVIDSLKIARQIFPGQRNNLDALCERYSINNSQRRVLHNALMDARILAHVFLFMTGSQTKIDFLEELNINVSKTLTNCTKQFLYNSKQYIDENKFKPLKIIYANKTEQVEHEKHLDLIEKLNKNCLWKKL